MGLTNNKSFSPPVPSKLPRKPRVKKFSESEPPEFKVGKSTPAEVIPIWAGEMRGMTPALLRGTLFGIFHDKDRPNVKGLQVCSMRGIYLSYTGELLNQLDLDVLIEVLHLGRGKKAGDDIKVSREELIRRLGLKSSGQTIQLLHERIERLLGGIVWVRTNNENFQGGLISSVRWHDVTGEMVFTLHKEIVNLFPNNTWAQFNPKVRNALGKNLLARWLHAHYATHVHPYPMTVETVHQLCGSEQSNPIEFRRQLKTAFTAIKAASKAVNENFDFKIVKEKGTGPSKEKVVYKVYVTPHRSSSQERYAQTHDIQPPMMPRDHTKRTQGHLLPPDPAFDDNEAC